MVVSKKAPGQEASDSVQVTRAEAFGIQFEFVNDWKPQKDVWPLKYGAAIAAGTAGLTGLLINNHFRRWLRLGRFGRFSSYAPVAILPALVGGVTHLFYVTRNIMVDDRICPVCMELRSIGLQMSLGFLYPMIFGPLGALRMAHGYRTYPVPRLLQDLPEVKRLYAKFVNIGYGKFATLIAVNFLIAAALPYLEMRTQEEWLTSLDRMEKDFEERVASGERPHPSTEQKLLRNSKEYPPTAYGFAKPL